MVGGADLGREIGDVSEADADAVEDDEDADLARLLGTLTPPLTPAPPPASLSAASLATSAWWWLRVEASMAETGKTSMMNVCWSPPL